MGEASMWSSIKDLSTEAMFVISTAASIRHTITTWRRELTHSQERRDRYAAQLTPHHDNNNNNNSEEKIAQLNRKIVDLDKSNKALDIQIGQLDAHLSWCVADQKQIRERLKEHFARLCLFNYIALTDPTDLIALMQLHNIKSPNALAFTLGKSILENSAAIIAEFSEDMGIPNLKVGTLFKLENGEFSVVPDYQHSHYGFDKKKMI